MGVNIGEGDESSPDRGYALYLASLIMVICAGLFVLGRLAARWSKRQFGWDDYTIVVSLVSIYDSCFQRCQPLTHCFSRLARLCCPSQSIFVRNKLPSNLIICLIII